MIPNGDGVPSTERSQAFQGTSLPTLYRSPMQIFTNIYATYPSG
jgi:hypothetical protein